MDQVVVAILSPRALEGGPGRFVFLLKPGGGDDPGAADGGRGGPGRLLFLKLPIPGGGGGGGEPSTDDFFERFFAAFALPPIFVFFFFPDAFARTFRCFSAFFFAQQRQLPAAKMLRALPRP